MGDAWEMQGEVAMSKSDEKFDEMSTCEDAAENGENSERNGVGGHGNCAEYSLKMP